MRLTWASPLFRGAAVAIFLSSLAISAAAPQLILFLANELHTSLSTAGLFYLTRLTAPAAGYLVGRRSDSSARRFGLYRVAVIAGFLGYGGIAVSTQAWMPFVLSATALSLSSASASQLFAAVHDEISAHPDIDGEGVLNIIRMALTAGWVVGPTIGYWLAAQVGLRWMLVAVAVCTAAQLLPIRRLREPALPKPVSTRAGDSVGGPAVARVSIRDMLPLLVFTGLCVLVYAGDTIKYGYLPVYMNEQLHLTARISGAVIGIQPLIELLLMPFSIMIARRFGALNLLAVGALFGVGADVCFATTGNVAGMFGGQILMGGVWGIFAGLGIIISQRLLPQAVASASAIFVSAPAISSALGGLTGSIGIATLGLPHVFFLPGVLALIAAVGLGITGRQYLHRALIRL